jgi:hypothetical protein
MRLLTLSNHKTITGCGRPSPPPSAGTDRK